MVEIAASYIDLLNSLVAQLQTSLEEAHELVDQCTKNIETLKKCFRLAEETAALDKEDSDDKVTAVEGKMLVAESKVLVMEGKVADVEKSITGLK
jgi:hypothetical protein